MRRRPPPAAPAPRGTHVRPALLLSVQHHGVHVVGVLGHGHEPVLGLARTDCGCGVQVMTARLRPLARAPPPPGARGASVPPPPRSTSLPRTPRAL